MKNHLIKTIGIFITLLFCSCSGDSDSSSTSTGNAPKIFTNLTFNPETPYFSTDGSMTIPVGQSQAMPIVNKIDITFIYSYDYFEPGFFDPKARANSSWYWDEYYQSWLINAVETRFYSTSLTESDFVAAKSDQSQIGVYFSSSTMVLAPHAIFPTGSCIGGRETTDPTSKLLQEGRVFGFKNTLSGKRGLIFIRNDQSEGWPIAFLDTNTKVDIIREN